MQKELVGGQLGLLGLGEQVGVQLMGERGGKVEGEMKKVDLSEGQEGWEVELLVPELDFGGVEGQQDLVGEECHRVTHR